MAERNRRGHPFLGAVGLALLAVPGFAVGVLAGIAWEDPGLLMAHLLGRSVEAPWGSVASTGAEPHAADAAKDEPRFAEPAPARTAAPAPARTATPAPARTATPAPARIAGKKLPDVAAPGPKAPPAETRARPVVQPSGSGPRFAVQVGAFSESRAAEGLVQRLRGKGFQAYVSPSAKPGAARWRVRVGPLASREKAEGVAARLKAEEELPTWVLDENAV